MLWHSIPDAEDCLVVDVLSRPYEHCLQEHGLPVAYGSIACAATEVYLHPSRFLFLGTVDVDGWHLGRPAKRLKRLPIGTREAMAKEITETTASDVFTVLSEGLTLDPEQKKRWSVLVNLFDPVTQTGPDGPRQHHTCLLFIWNGRVTILDPLGSASPFRTLLEAALKSLPATLSALNLASQCHWVDRPLYASHSRFTSVLWTCWAIDQMVTDRPQDDMSPSVKVYTLLEWLGRIKVAIAQLVLANAATVVDDT